VLIYLLRHGEVIMIAIKNNFRYLLLFSFLLLFACSKITLSNFDKIKPNMTMKEVVAILGEPTNSESVTIVGVSGTSAIWKNTNAEIDIQFLNGRVLVKTFSKPQDDAAAPAPAPENTKVST
jgi:hypothetical protein